MLTINKHPVEVTVFPGGEVNVTLPVKYLKNTTTGTFIFNTIINNSDDLLALLLSKNALENLLIKPRHCVLKLAYVPYARQDRVCHEGEACSIKVFADLINSLNFDLVIVCDVHSKATLDLLNNVSEIPQVNVIGKHEHLFTNYDYIVCPDHGARNKTIDVANTLKKPVVFASKTRDQKTGKITSSLDFDYSEIPPNKSFLIVDDICDGGRTFIELEKLLRTLKPVTIDLYVTHGIFSKGLKVFSNFGNIYTTDSLGDKTDTAKEFGMYNEKYIHKLTTLTWI